MLGSLAKWLRIFGFDTYYPSSEATDDDLLQKAKQEQRMIISRDKELIARAKKESIPILGIHATNLQEQITQVLTSLPFDSIQILTRCIVCNTPLQSIAKETAKPHVLPKVYESRDEFWFCPICSKYYWKGTHYENMSEKINELRKKPISAYHI